MKTSAFSQLCLEFPASYSFCYLVPPNEWEAKGFLPWGLFIPLFSFYSCTFSFCERFSSFVLLHNLLFFYLICYGIGCIQKTKACKQKLFATHKYFDTILHCLSCLGDISKLDFPICANHPTDYIHNYFHNHLTHKYSGTSAHKFQAFYNRENFLPFSVLLHVCLSAFHNASTNIFFANKLPFLINQKSSPKHSKTC